MCVVCAGRSVQEQQSVCNLYNEYTVCALSQHCLAAASDECRKRASLAASMPPSHRIRLESGGREPIASHKCSDSREERCLVAHGLGFRVLLLLREEKGVMRSRQTPPPLWLLVRERGGAEWLLGFDSIRFDSIQFSSTRNVATGFSSCQSWYC